MDGCVIGKEFGGGPIDKVYGSKESLIPLFQSHGGMGKQG
jgi:hypothetical protein